MSVTHIETQGALQMAPPTLINPFIPKNVSTPVEATQAVNIADLYLTQTGLSDFETLPDRIDAHTRFFRVPYRNSNEPELAAGGGAALIVRKSDGVCAMLHIQQDWLNWSDAEFWEQAESAFALYDCSQV